MNYLQDITIIILLTYCKKKIKKIKKDKLKFWSKYIQPNVRNPIFKNLNIFSKKNLKIKVIFLIIKKN